MRSLFSTGNRGLTGSAVLLLTLLVTGGSLAAWKRASLHKADAAAAHQPEPIESITAAVAEQRSYRPTTTSIGTVLALNSITFGNARRRSSARSVATTGLPAVEYSRTLSGQAASKYGFASPGYSPTSIAAY